MTGMVVLALTVLSLVCSLIVLTYNPFLSSSHSPEARRVQITAVVVSAGLLMLAHWIAA